MPPWVFLGAFGIFLAALINELNPENADRGSGRAPPRKRKARPAAPPPPDDEEEEELGEEEESES